MNGAKILPSIFFLKSVSPTSGIRFSEILYGYRSYVEQKSNVDFLKPGLGMGLDR